MKFESPQHHFHNNWHLAALVSITLLAIWLRFKGLIFQSYWLDEMASLYLAHPGNTILEVLNSALKDNTTPLYQLVLWLWFKLFGLTEYSGRSLSAFFGVCSVIAMYYLGKEYINTRAGMFASAITCTNQYLIYYSQEVRSYQLLFLLTALTLLFLSRLLRLKNGREFYIYTVLCVCLIQTHYYGILIYSAQAIIIVLYAYARNSRDLIIRKYFWINAAITIISLLPALPYLIKGALRKSFWIKTPAPDFYIDYFIEYFVNKELALLFALLCLLGLIHVYRNVDTRQKNIFYLTLTFLFFIYLLPYARSVISTPMLVNRYTIGILPIIILLACSGLELINSRKTGLYLCVFIFLFSLGLIFIKNDYYHQIKKEQYREALQIITATDNEAIVFCYYNRGLVVYADVLGYDLDIRKNTQDTLNELKAGTFWFIAWYDNKDEWEYLLDDQFRFIDRNDIRLVKSIQKHKLRVLQYELNTG